MRSVLGGSEADPPESALRLLRRYQIESAAGAEPGDLFRVETVQQFCLFFAAVGVTDAQAQRLARRQSSQTEHRETIVFANLVIVGGVRKSQRLVLEGKTRSRNSHMPDTKPFAQNDPRVHQYPPRIHTGA